MKKILGYLKVGLDFAGKAIKNIYFSPGVVALEAIIIYLAVSHLLGIVFLALGVVLLLNEMKLNK